MVSYRDSDGQQQYHETDELGEAIAYVEHLRNDEAVDHARIFKLDEVSFEFRPYFRVEIAERAAPTAPPAAEAQPAGWTPPADAPADDEASDMERDPLAAAWAASDRPEDHVESVGAGMGRRGLFGR